MPRIGARTDLKKTERYIRENLGAEVNEKLSAKIAERNAKRIAAKQAKTIKAQKLHEMAQARRQSFLERTPATDIFKPQSNCTTLNDIIESMVLK